MWFSRNQRNRRFKRDKVLEVKLRSNQVRAARTRLGAQLAAACLATVFVLFAVWYGGEWLMDQVAYRNDAFAIRRIQVETDGVIATEQIRRWAGVAGGQNLLSLDLARVKRDLELVPMIHSAVVERVLPDTLKLRVNERRPLAQIYALVPRGPKGYDPVVYHIDETGYIMLPMDPRLRAAHAVRPREMLPTLTSVSTSDLRPGGRVASDSIHAALKLIEEFEQSPMSGLVDLKYIDVAGPEVLRVRTAQGNEITFSPAQFDWQLRRWRVVHDTGMRRGLSIATLDLSVSNNSPARWMEMADSTASEPAKPPKQPAPRKRNV